MAATATFIAATRFFISYTVAEAAGAAGADVQDVLADLTGAGITSGPLWDLFNNNGVAYASQAAARTAMSNNAKVTVHNFALALGAGPTGYCTPTVDFNVAGGGVGNFRTEFSSIKQGNNNTATYVVTIERRHSIVL